MKNVFALFSFAVLLIVSVPAILDAKDVPLSHIYDDSMLRKKFAGTIFIEPPYKTLSRKPYIETLLPAQRSW